jgi:hypothetical protein
LNWKGDPLRLHYTSTLTDNNNVYGENVGKNVTEKKSWMKSHKKKVTGKEVTRKKSQEKSHKKKVTGKKVTYMSSFR